MLRSDAAAAPDSPHRPASDGPGQQVFPQPSTRSWITRLSGGIYGASRQTVTFPGQGGWRGDLYR